MSDPNDKTGEVTIHGGVVHCPGGHRAWTVSVLNGEFKIFCTGCKRCFVIEFEPGQYDLKKAEFINVLDKLDLK